MKIDLSFIDEYMKGLGDWFDKTGYFRWIAIAVVLIMLYVIYKI